MPALDVILFLFPVLFILHSTGAAGQSYSNSNSTSTSVVLSSSSTCTSSSSGSTYTSKCTSSSSSSSSSHDSFTYKPSTNTTYYDPLNKAEKEALLTFFRKIEIPTTFTWNESQPGCSWTGVTCNPNSITVLYLTLPHMSLTGQIPPKSIGMLSSLRVLSLRCNNLYGEIPSDFARLWSLTTLRLDNNSFSGNISSFFSAFVYLTRLDLNNNNFSGQLPDISTVYLNDFNVSFNRLVGRIPRSLSDFPKSAFSNNTYLCAKPFDPCNASYPTTNSDVDQLDDTRTGNNRKIFGVYSVSGLVSLIMFCSAVKKTYHHIKQSSKGSGMERKKLVMLDDTDFKIKDLLKTAAEVLGSTVGMSSSYKQVLAKDVTVVVKVLKDVVVTEEEFRTTMEGLGKMKKQYVVPLRGFYSYSNDEKWIVYDYMPAATLYDRLHGSIGSVQIKLDWNHRMRIALSAAKGLAYLHVDEKVVHGNIKSSNIFLQQEINSEVSLSDYGLNGLYCGSRSLNYQVTGYRAPEILETQKITSESDVYSFGVVVLELLTGKNPNQASLNKEGVHFSEWVMSVVCEEPKAELFDVELIRDNNNIGKMMQLLLIAKECVAIVPNQRPPMHVVVNMMEDML